MKILLVLSALLVASQCVPFLESEKLQWNLFKTQHSKRYSSLEEEETRLRIYQENSRMIAEHNERFEKGEVSYSMKMNQFGDLSHEEFVATVGLVNLTSSLLRRTGEPYVASSNLEAPSSIDWRQKGAVTGVKNQGSCGSCWAFSVTGAIESHQFIKTKKLVSLSEQNLVDCSRPYGTLGCSGGWMNDAFRYVQANQGIDTETSYQYEAKEGSCRYNAAYRGATITGYVDIQSGNENQLRDAVGNVGPVAIAFDASQKTFQFAGNGIYYDPACFTNKSNHAVLVVGYGSENGMDYWLVKNSWSAQWGDQGYFKLARNRNNQCGVATYASYPKV